MNRFSLSALVLLLAACPASPRRFPGPSPYNAPPPQQLQQQATPPPQPVTPPPTNAGATVSSNPVQALNQIDGYLRQQGYTRLGPAVHNPSMPTNGVTAYAITARANACYTLVAFAQPGVNLDLLVLDAWGRTIAYNVDPDAHPWVTTCPGGEGRLIARLQMTAGSGEYYYAAYEGSPQAQPNLAALFGGARQTTVQIAQIDATTAERVQALDQRLGSESFRRAAEPVGTVFATGEDRLFRLNLTQGACYAFATFGGPGAEDTDVYLLGGGGDELANDVGSDVDSLVRYCPPQTGAYQLRARMYRGAGPLFTAAYLQTQAAAPANASPQVISSQSTAGAGLEENFRLLDADMRARGYEPYGDQARGVLSSSDTRDFSIELEGGKCYAILAVGDNGIRALDLMLLDRAGRMIDRDAEQNARPIVRVCPESSGHYSMRVGMRSGQGNFVYAPYRWPRGVRGPFNLNGLIYVRLGEVTSLLDHEGYEPDTDASPGRGSRLPEGQERSHNLSLPANRCYSILVVGGDGVNDLDVTLSRGRESLATDGTHNAFPNVRYCTTAAGRLELKVKATSGAGDYFFQVFRRSDGS